MKSYEFKLYDRLGKYKKTINPLSVTSEITFSEDINGGQWSLTLDIVENMAHFDLTDILEIREVSDDSPEIIPTFTGIIEEIQITEYAEKDVLSIELLGLGAMLSDMFFKQGSTRKFNKNASITNIFKEVVDNFNAEYGDLSSSQTQNLGKKILHYTVNSIEENLPNFSLECDNTTYLEVLKKITESTNIVFFIDATGLVTAKQKEHFSKILLTMGREVINYNHTIKKREMCNVYHLSGDGDIAQTFVENSSIQKFGKKEKSDSDSALKNHNDLVAKWTDFLQKKAFPESEISLITKPQKSNNIFPWMLVSLQNVRNPINNQQITKIEKNTENWTIYVWDFPNFGKIISGK